MKIKVTLTAIILLLPILVWSQHPHKPGFYLQQFSNPKIDGCADYFYLSKKDKNQQRNIFVHDFARIAYVKINGKTEKLIYKSGTLVNNAIFSNSNYSLNLKTTSRKSTGPESYTLTAILTVYHKGKMIITKKIIGDGGC